MTREQCVGYLATGERCEGLQRAGFQTCYPHRGQEPPPAGDDDTVQLGAAEPEPIDIGAGETPPDQEDVGAAEDVAGEPVIGVPLSMIASTMLAGYMAAGAFHAAAERLDDPSWELTEGEAAKIVPPLSRDIDAAFLGRFLPSTPVAGDRAEWMEAVGEAVMTRLGDKITTAVSQRVTAAAATVDVEVEPAETEAAS